MIKEIQALVEGDTIVIITPAKSIDSKFIDSAVTLFKSWGLKVEVGEYAKGNHYYFSGTDDERVADLQWALNHPKAKAIFCSRGGYGTIKIVEEVDYSMFIENPKWLIGFSDVTVLHNKIHSSFELPSIHGMAALNIDKLNKNSRSFQTLKNCLFGKMESYSFPFGTYNRKGDAKGTLTGGNLAILESLIGTTLDICTDGKILFIEEIGEHAYKVERMLWSLKKAGKFDKLKGLIVGQLTNIEGSEAFYGKPIEEVIYNVVSEFEFPVAFNFPAGHELENESVVLGKTCQLNVSVTESKLTYL